MQSLKFTIVTPTVLRPSLAEACLSLNTQDYSNWEHIVIIDNPDESLSWDKSLEHPNRRFLRCPKIHHNVGNTCRHSIYNEISPDTSYVLYLDDDNKYLPNALQTLSDALRRLLEPSWGTFPMTYLGKFFCEPNPRRNYVDTGQIYHKPIINNTAIIYPDTDDYAGDAVLVEALKKFCPPTVLSWLPPLLIMPVRSHGAVVSPSNNSLPFTVVIPNHFEDVIAPLLKDLQHEGPNLDVIIISDNHDRNYGYKNIRLDGDFVFSRSANAGFNYAGQKDIILINDDARIPNPGIFRKLFTLAHSDSSLGILSPLIDGGCGSLYMSLHRRDLWKNGSKIMYRKCCGHDYVSFVCVYIKRQLINQIGLMDENFVGYGRDDADYCIRAVSNGWKVGITREAIIRHGVGGRIYVRGKNWNTSFKKRNMGDSNLTAIYFNEKYPKESKKPLFPMPHAKTQRRSIENKLN